MTRPSSSAGRMLVVFGPILALGAFTILAALVSGLAGFYRVEAYAVAVVLGVFMMLLATVLFFQQTAARRASERALEISRARENDVLGSAMDPIVCVDESQRIILVNAAAESVFGWPRDALIGQPLDKLIPDRFRTAHRAHVERFGRTGATSRRMGKSTVLLGLRAGGEEFPIEASISQHSEGANKVFTVILRDVTERIRAENALRASQRELHEFSQVSQSAREQEKSRIARELHDELAQALTALKIDLAWLAGRLPGADSALSEKLGKMQAMLDATVASTRRISADLRPLMLDDLGLAAAVEWLVDNFRERNAVECELETAGGDLDLPEPYASCVFRILQESLTNVARHSGASRVRVVLNRNGSDVALTVTDNGRGFVPEAPRRPGSFGLTGLRERAYLVNGKVRIDSAPGRGTTIDVRIPLEAADEVEK